MKRLFVLLVLCQTILWSGVAYGHGVSYGLTDEAAFVVHFSYSGNEPMSYVTVQVFGPQSTPDLEFQNGRTDANGRFAFTPDQVGAWTVEASDQTGHKGVFHVDITETMLKDGHVSTSPATQGTPEGDTPLRTLLGVSILLNLGLASVVFKRRRGTCKPV